ncbi:MAG: carboxylesterase family protein, partial [Mycoplasmataceae bacterium]|nr:carboxylesterase family protein [Mycoplasmataceae bacterium]
MQNKIIKSLCSKKNLFKLTTGALLSSISFATPFLMASCSFDLRASTIYGKIRGTRQDGIYSFKGIPYAKAPVGDLKFAPPHNPDHWKGIKKCTHYGDACIQEDAAGWNIHPQGEDCLNLNIWTPTLDKNQKLPVYVYIHGGVFTIGSSSQEVFDGHYLSNDG